MKDEFEVKTDFPVVGIDTWKRFKVDMNVICELCGKEGFKEIKLWTNFTSMKDIKEGNKPKEIKNIDLHNICEECAIKIKNKLSFHDMANFIIR